eukprot:gene11201-21348_t
MSGDAVRESMHSARERNGAEAAVRCEGRRVKSTTSAGWNEASAKGLMGVHRSVRDMVGIGSASYEEAAKVFRPKGKKMPHRAMPCGASGTRITVQRSLAAEINCEKKRREMIRWQLKEGRAGSGYRGGAEQRSAGAWRKRRLQEVMRLNDAVTDDKRQGSGERGHVDDWAGIPHWQITEKRPVLDKRTGRLCQTTSGAKRMREQIKNDSMATTVVVEWGHGYRRAQNERPRAKCRNASRSNASRPGKVGTGNGVHREERSRGNDGLFVACSLKNTQMKSRQVTRNVHEQIRIHLTEEPENMRKAGRSSRVAQKKKEKNGVLCTDHQRKNAAPNLRSRQQGGSKE